MWSPTASTGSVALIRRGQCLTGGVALQRGQRQGCKLVEGEAYTVDKGLIRDDVALLAPDRV